MIGHRIVVNYYDPQLGCNTEFAVTIETETADGQRYVGVDRHGEKWEVYYTTAWFASLPGDWD
jgi:hypothetical protein